jgi:YD repeat-containing protein
MKISYDHEVDALYILFKDTTVTTKHLAEGIAADYDAQGRLGGIEILDAMKRLDDPTTFRQVILEDIAIARRTR